MRVDDLFGFRSTLGTHTAHILIYTFCVKVSLEFSRLLY